MFYFAYGSNMDEVTIRRAAPSAKALGGARLEGYRLRFGRISKQTDTGVADLVEDADFTVMGVLYEIAEAEVDGLRKKEGVYLNPPAYRKDDVEVYFFAQKWRVKAFTFFVVQPEEVEPTPSLEYLDKILDGIRPYKFTPYVEFLEWLRRSIVESPRRPLRQGLLAVGTTVRTNSRGRYIVRANPACIDGITDRTNAVAVEFDGRVVIASFQADRSLSGDRCEIDQNLRNILGIRGAKYYGQTVRLHPSRLLNRPRVLRPRNIGLSLHQTNWADAEKRICVLHPRNITLLGLDEGQRVEIECSVFDADGTVQTRTARLRVYSSVARGQDGKPDYPAVNCVYLDRECRAELGLTTEPTAYLDWPMLVRPSIRNLVKERIAVYGVTFFLGMAAVGQLTAQLFPKLPLLAQGVIVLGVAVLATGLVAIVDIRTKVQY